MYFLQSKNDPDLNTLITLVELCLGEGFPNSLGVLPISPIVLSPPTPTCAVLFFCAFYHEPYGFSMCIDRYIHLIYSEFNFSLLWLWSKKSCKLEFRWGLTDVEPSIYICIVALGGHSVPQIFNYPYYDVKHNFNIFCPGFSTSESVEFRLGSPNCPLWSKNNM